MWVLDQALKNPPFGRHSYRDNIVGKLKHHYVKTGERAGRAYFRCSRCGDTYSSPIIEITDPKPPVSEYSLGDRTAPASSGCTTQRILKETITETHSYIYAGGKLLRETIETNGTSKTLDFRYDNAGTPYALIYNDGSNTSVYYYVTNLQGDVMYLVDTQGNRVAAYTYDPFGKVLTATGTMADINPLRYRGYYYDTESELYYLQSRYYDPATCRFLNADSYSSTGQGILGHNMFAYCGNNPILRKDDGGEFWHIVAGAAIGAAISFVSSIASDMIAGEKVDLASAGMSAAFGALNGALAATGLGMTAQVVGGAVLAGAENYCAQGREKGFKNVNYFEVAGNAIVAGFSSRSNGISKSVAKHLNKQGINATNRIIASWKYDKLKGVWKSVVPTYKYYVSQTNTLFYKPLFKDNLETFTDSILTDTLSSFAIPVQ